MTTVGYITTDLEPLGESDPDEALLASALSELGVDLVPGRWRERDTEWSAMDLILVGSPWDYHLHLDEFMSWLDDIEARVPLANPASIIRWNLDKTYLGRLADAGVPVVPTSYCVNGDDVENTLSAVGAGSATAQVVIKPTVSAGSHDTGLFDAEDPAAAALAASIIARGATAMVQPAISSVTTHGEVAAICLGERPFHWVSKGPILKPGGGFLGGTYTEQIGRIDAPDGAREAADSVLSALAEVRSTLGLVAPLDYARIDLVRLDDGSFALLEAELFEPSLFLDHAPASAPYLARILADRAG